MGHDFSQGCDWLHDVPISMNRTRSSVKPGNLMRIKQRLAGPARLAMTTSTVFDGMTAGQARLTKN